MNICLPGDDYLPSTDGAVTSIMSYTKEFRKLGHRVYIPCPSYPDLNDPSVEYKDNEPDIIRYKSRPAPFPPKYRMTLTWQTKIDWRPWNLDIVHSQSPFPLGYHGLTWARRLGIPAINTYHTLYPEYVNTYVNKKLVKKPLSFITKMFSKWVLNKFDLVISPSPQMAGDLVKYGVTKPIEVMPTGIDIDRFKVNYSGDAFRQKYGIKKDEKMLLCMCRLGREKNVNFLIEAMPVLLKQVPNAKLVICGEGVAKPELEAQVRKLGIENKVIFLGFLNREDWVNAYAAEDVFAFASKTETQGLVLLEAMYFNKPAVCIGEMGVIDVLEGFDKQRGGFLTKDDVNDFSAKIASLLTDKALYDKKAKEGHEKAMEMSSENMARKMLKIYERVIEEHKRNKAEEK
ncbi:MAG: glycosyltransferase [Candidatus Firestonebacteria bacterium]